MKRQSRPLSKNNSQRQSHKKSRNANNSAKAPENLIDAEKKQEIQLAFQQYCEPKRKTKKNSSAKKKNSTKSKGEEEMSISLPNTQLALQTLGVEMTMEELQHELKDTTCILESEFLKVATVRVFQIEQAHKSFQLMDQNEKGVVVLEDLEHAAQELGEEWTHDELVEMMNLVDRNGHGLLDVSDFVRIAKRVNL